MAKILLRLKQAIQLEEKGIVKIIKMKENGIVEAITTGETIEITNPKIIKKEKVSVEEINDLLDILETKIEEFTNTNGLDSLTDMADWEISSICVNALRRELISKFL